MRRRRAAPGPAPDQSLNPASRRRILDQRDALYRARRRSQEDQERLGGEPQPDALPSCASIACMPISCRTPRSVGRPALPSTAEARWPDQERSAEIRDDLARVQAIVDRQRHFSSTARSGCGAGPARNRKHARPARIDRLARYDQKFMSRRAGFSAQVFLRESRRTETGAHARRPPSGRCSSSWLQRRTPKTLSDSKISEILSSRASSSRAAPSPSTGVDADSFREHEEIL